MKKLLTACLLTTVLCGATFAETVFDFKYDATLYGVLDNQPGPISFTNSGLVATFTASDGEMNRTTSGFGLNSSIPGDDTDAFDIGEWINITFGVEVTLTNVAVSSWSTANGDQATIYVNGVSNGVINSSGDHAFNINVPSGQTLKISSTAGVVGNAWSLDSITVDAGAPSGNLAPVLGAIGNKSVIVSNELSFTVSATDINGDDIVLSASGLPSGATFNTVTNAAAVTNTFTWTDAAPTGTYFVTFTADDGTTNDSETITITVAESPSGFTFDFLDDADLYGALDDQAGPVTYTNNGLVATFTASVGTMNRTTSGFGINAGGFTDTDGFDIGEWIDITFEAEMVLTNINVSSWSTINGDEAVIYVNGVSNGVITSTGSKTFNILVPSNEVLRIECTAGSAGNGFSLDSIAVKLYQPVAPVLEPIGDKEVIVGNPLSFDVIATDENGDDITLSVSNLPPGAVFNTVTNAGAVTNTFTWASAAPVGVYTPTFIADDGTASASETITITVVETPQLLISEVADPADVSGGSGAFKYRFVEIYNAGTNTIDLAAGGWSLSRQNNGGTWSDLALTGTIGPAETYVVASTTNFAEAYGFAPDQTSGVADGNGFDAYFLFIGGDHTSGVLIDIYGELDTDGDGTVWDYQDSRALRKPELEPNTTWTASEWIITSGSTTNMFTPATYGPAPEFAPALENQQVTLGDSLSLTVTATNVLNASDTINLSAIILPDGATFPAVEGTGTVSSTLNWSPTNTGFYTVTFAAEGLVDSTYESITVQVLSIDPPVISLSIPAGGPITLAWPASVGSSFNVLTNSSLLDTNGWGNANLIPFLDGGSYKVTNSIGSEPKLFYKLESQ